MGVLIYGLVGLLILGATVTLYFGGGGDVPATLNEWASFGTYIAGIAGPLLSFVALVAVARTLHLQRETLDLDREKQLADQHLRWLDALYSDISDALSTPVATGVTLGSVLDEQVNPKTVDQKRLQSRLENLLKLASHYCRAVDMYRDNVSEFYDLQIYQDRGGRLLDAIKPLSGYLSNCQVGPTIEFCDMHLRGEHERAKPEAMTRSSRGY
ncbi:hypothetical protein [Erythrobacter aureus]|uniref:Uncharacterized protein n=1 Tax=Erythrobacter aureus TaxID=2182384 RepID=A0A345YD78_9SPHN|nr:hypothetical protein [Erythrobacter aureus]AXK41880.1 hypothetical protein DVR09_05565 [Erythrobacter aureus]